MKTRLTLKPGQNGTKKLQRKYGGRLLAVPWQPDRKLWQVTLSAAYGLGLDQRIVS